MRGSTPFTGSTCRRNAYIAGTCFGGASELGDAGTRRRDRRARQRRSLIASRSGLDFFDPENGELERFVAPEVDLPGNRPNDGKCDRQGRFWYGTMQNNFAPDMSETAVSENSGWLYRIDPDGG